MNRVVPRRRQSPLGMVVLSLFFILLPLVFLGVGVTQLHREAHLLNVAVPVPAHILGSWVDVHHGSKSTTYRPVVRYTYRTGGQTFTSDCVLMVGESGSQAWAQAIIRRYAAGSDATAYCDPTEVRNVFLSRTPQLTPYAFVLFPLLHLSVGLALLVSTLRPTTRPGAVRTRVQLLGSIWMLVALGVVLHSTLVMPVHSLGLRIGESLVGLVGIALWIVAARLPRASAATPARAALEEDQENPYRRTS